MKAKLSGKEAWGYWPAYGVGLLDLRSVEGSHVLFSEFAGKATLSIPGAFTHETESAKLKKGDLVLATIVTSGKCARIEEVTGESAKVSFIWGDKLDSRDFEMNKLLRLDGKLGFGAPTLRKNDVGEWFAGTLVYADAKTAWIAGEFMSPEAKAPVADVHPVDITKQRKKGDKVLACAFAMGGCAEVTIAGPLYGGLAYEVSLPKDMDNHEDPKAKTAIVDACHMMSAPKK